MALDTPTAATADRACMMLRAAEILEADKDTFGRLMTLEMGKPLRAAVEAQIGERHVGCDQKLVAGLPFGM